MSSSIGQNISVTCDGESLSRDGSGSEAQQSHALAVIPRSIPSTQRSSQPICNSSSNGTDALFWPPGARHRCGTQINMYKTPRHIKQKLKFKNTVMKSNDLHMKSYKCYENALSQKMLAKIHFDRQKRNLKIIGYDHSQVVWHTGPRDTQVMAQLGPQHMKIQTI